jgi:hypothetical protein
MDDIYTTNRDNENSHADESNEYRHPIKFFGNKTETVGGYRASKIAEAVEYSRDLARISIGFKRKRHHTGDDVVNTTHKAGNDAENTNRYGKMRSR